MKKKETENDLKDLLAFAAFNHHMDNARFYSSIQRNYKSLGIKWLIGALVGVGFMLSSYQYLPFNSLIAGSIVSFLGAISMYILWYEDTVVFELFLNLEVFYALKLEQVASNKEMPKLHHSFVRIHELDLTLQIKTRFYLVCKTTLFILSVSLLTAYLVLSKSYTAMATILPIYIALFFLSHKVMISRNSEFRDLEEVLVNV